MDAIVVAALGSGLSCHADIRWRIPFIAHFDPMAARRSAGLLIYRQPEGILQVFLVHPGGPFWRKRDEGAWSVPKGELTEGEDGLQAAQREFREETGLAVEGTFQRLRPIRQAGGKIVEAWAIAADCDAGSIRSNVFSMEWPPGSGRTQSFPEVDRAGWFELAEARRKIIAGQIPLLDELAALVGHAKV